MMSLPADLDRCLHKHTSYLLHGMAPDGVYVYLSGAKLLHPEDHQRYTRAHDNYGKNHALLTAVANCGKKGFEAFLEALETTNQTDIADRLRAALDEKNGNVPSNTDSIAKVKNGGEMTSSRARKDVAHPGPSSASGVYIVRPQPTPSAGSPPMSSRDSRRRSVTQTPLTPPLTEAELDEHLARLKSLLKTITSTHTNPHCELGQAGDAMMDRMRELSEENLSKERELRRAKFMVRGMETEIQRMRTSTSTSTSASAIATTPLHASPSSGEQEKNGKPPKSKLCVIL
ncbi:hypothetical protein ACOMHN_028859 [Nucella lapillus]